MKIDFVSSNRVFFVKSRELLTRDVDFTRWDFFLSLDLCKGASQATRGKVTSRAWIGFNSFLFYLPASETEPTYSQHVPDY